MTEPELLIGSPQSAFIRVVPLSRSGHDPADYWDSNWVVADVEVVNGSFRAKVRASLRTDEFQSFRAELAPLYESSSGEARFSSLEAWIEIHVSGDGRGHFAARCEVVDDPGGSTRLQTAIHFDQTTLPAVLRGLEAIEAKFPVLGSPDG